MEWLIFLGLVVFFTINLLTAWLDGGLRDAFLRRINYIDEAFYTKEDIDRQLFAKESFLGSLLACPICSSSYFALAISLIFLMLFNLPWWFPLAAFFAPQYLAKLLFK